MTPEHTWLVVSIADRKPGCRAQVRRTTSCPLRGKNRLPVTRRRADQCERSFRDSPRDPVEQSSTLDDAQPRTWRADTACRKGDTRRGFSQTGEGCGVGRQPWRMRCRALQQGLHNPHLRRCRDMPPYASHGQTRPQCGRPAIRRSSLSRRSVISPSGLKREPEPALRGRWRVAGGQAGAWPQTISVPDLGASGRSVRRPPPTAR
jgi:hypothetical protein